MNFFINSPAYYSQVHGVDDEIHKICRRLSRAIDINKYTNIIDTIAITPIVVPTRNLQPGQWSETKRVSLVYRMADISLRTDYNVYVCAGLDGKKDLILENILRSLRMVKQRLRARFDYEGMKNDIMLIWQQ